MSQLPMHSQHAGEMSEYSPVDLHQPPPASPNPLITIHNLLRGRYKLAVLLAVIGLAVGAPIGYFAMPPTYRAIGQIEVRSSLTPLLYQTEQNQQIQNFNSFLITQMELLKSSRVIGLAMQDPEWRAFGRGLDPEAVQKFNDSLEVSSPRNSQLLQVFFRDKDPSAAAAAVKSLIRAYERVFVDLEVGLGTGALAPLNELRLKQESDLKAIINRMRLVAEPYDPGSLQRIHDTKLQLWLEAETQAKQAEIQATLMGTPTGSSQPQEGSTDTRDQVFETLKARDPWYTQLEKDRLAAERSLREASARFLGRHPNILDAQAKLKAVEEDLAERAEELRKIAQAAESGQTVALPAAQTQSGLDPAIAARIWRTTAERLKGELDTISTIKQQVDDLRIEEQAARDVLEATKQRITQLNVEASRGSNRLYILSYGEKPLAPEKDRRIALSAVGGMGMAGLGVGIVMAIGFFDRRLRHIDTTVSQLRPIDRLLGVLPEVPGGAAGLAASNEAIYCINHLRAMLQIRQRATGHRLLGVTSPTPGDGKTTVTLEVGRSLAQTGARVCIVDCDFDGGGLTSAVRSLIKSAGTVQMFEPTVGGVSEALRGVPLDHVVVPTGIKNLTFLPLGVEPGSSLHHFSPEAVHQLFTRLMNEYDIVLIDTGPILGSIEAKIVASEVQGMIVVVSRGGNRGDADHATQVLREAGAEIEGLVFNRAMHQDVNRSVYRSSISARSMRYGDSQHVNGSNTTLVGTSRSNN